MNDKNFKAMWNNAENFMGSKGFESAAIEQFISKRSNSTAQKVKNMIFLDIVSNKIEMQQKQDRANKILLAIVFVIGFVFLIAIFKK